jgi:lipid-A-disaccharide synthase
MRSPTLFICAAEVSGDVRGARLATELRQLLPGIELFGLGGARMAAAGVELGADITDTSTIGWLDHWATTPRYLTALRWCRRAMRQRRPRALIVIDAPGISFPMARFGRSLGLPVAYYVTPQTWLWDPRGAVDRLRRSVDIVVPAFGAEADLYRRAGLDVLFEGHPIRDDAAWPVPGEERVRPQESGGQAVVGLVPGSRRHAIHRLLPPMLDAAGQLREAGAAGPVVVSLASERLRSDVESRLNGQATNGVSLTGDFAGVLRRSSVLIAASGSNLLDAVLADVPVVACYRIDPVSYWIAEYVMNLRGRLPAFTLPNLLARQAVVPEMIQSDVTGTRLAWQAIRLLGDEEARGAMLSGYRMVRAALGEPGVVARIAAALVNRLGLC